MLLGRKVFIRILTLLQRKTLIKCLKRHYSTVRSMKNVAVSTHPGGFVSSRVLTPVNLPSKAKKKTLMPGGQPRGEAGAAGID